MIGNNNIVPSTVNIDSPDFKITFPAHIRQIITRKFDILGLLCTDGIGNTREIFFYNVTLSDDVISYKFITALVKADSKTDTKHCISIKEFMEDGAKIICKSFDSYWDINNNDYQYILFDKIK